MPCTPGQGHGAGDPRARRRLRAGAQGQPAGAARRTCGCCSTIPRPRRTTVATTTDGDHGRIETRRAAIVHDVAWLAETHGFPGLKAIGKVTATREQDGRATTATRYYLLSRPLTAARFLEVVRAHWQIENRLHWVLDVVLDEDQARARKDHAPENLARLRRFALNVLRANRDPGLDPRQDQTRRLGRRLPPQTPRLRLMRGVETSGIV